MEEYLLQLRNYLPVLYTDPENEKYIEYLANAYEKNIEAETYQFAFVAFHLLFMSFIYKTVWLLKQAAYENVDQLLRQYAGDIQVVNSPFDFSTMDEAKSFKILKCLGFHPNEIDLLSSQVKYRNHCSHASGKIHYLKEDIERFMSDELKSSDKIFQKTKSCLTLLLKTFIYDNWDPDTREFLTSKDAVNSFISQNYLSSKELEILISVIIPELHKRSNNKKNIYIKTIYLIFLFEVQKYIDNDEHLLLTNLHILMNGFNEQSDISLETLINDEFSVILRDFNEKDKNTFAQITQCSLPNILSQTNNENDALISP